MKTMTFRNNSNNNTMKPEIKSFLSGIALVVGLTLVFLVLKLTGIISWSWWAVTSLLLVYAAILVIMFIITMCVYFYYQRNH